MHDEILIKDDICLRISTKKLSGQSLKFRFWLNVKFLLEGVGKVNQHPFRSLDELRLGHFMIKEEEHNKFDYDYQ